MGYQVKPFSRKERFFLAITVFIGVLLRVFYQWDRPFVGDEIGTLKLINKSIPYLLSHFELWLTMNYFIVMEKVIAMFFGKGVFVLGAVPLLAGITTIPLTARVASRFSSTRVALIAALLVALNPYLIIYSGVVRSYSLMVCFTLIVLDLFFNWRAKPGIKQGSLLAIAIYLLVLIHPNGVYVVAYIVLFSLVDFLVRKDTGVRPSYIKTMLIPLCFSFLLILASYAFIIPEMLVDGVGWHDTPPTNISYLPYAFGVYFGIGFWGWLSAVLFFLALFIAIKKESPLLVLFPLIILPVVLMSVQGLSHFPWAYARFMIFLVPVLILFISQGLINISEFFPGSKRTVVGLVVVGILVLTWLPDMINQFKVKYDEPWHKVAESIKEKYLPGDIIVSNDGMTDLHLYPYFHPSSRGKFLFRKYLRKKQEKLANRVFYVTNTRFLETGAPQYLLGNIQVIEYSNGGEDNLKEILQDLAKTIAEKQIDPLLADHYLNYYLLNNRLGVSENNIEIYKLWSRCDQLTRRNFNMPYNRKVYRFTR